ncbi:MAG: cache domain-containing protein [Ignavibacteriaceae bacterium]
MSVKINRKKFFLNIVLPTLLTQTLFILLIFAVIIPYFNDNLINAKKEMIREIVNTSMGIAEKNYKDARDGVITFEEAKRITITTFKNIRYGEDNKDYIWITDNNPVMIMHPYKKELNGRNVENFTDPDGMKMFSEMVKMVKENGEGFVYYSWQWMDDSARIVPKISFVKEFKEWKWIIGTGVYIEDVRESIDNVVSSMIWTSLAIFILVSFLLYIVVRRNLRVEHERNQAELSLQESNEKYKALVEASGEGTLMFMSNRCIFGNQKIIELLKQDALANINPDLDNIIDKSLSEDIEKISLFLAGKDDSLQIETRIINRDNFPLFVLISFSKISISGSDGLIVIIKDLSFNREDSVINFRFSEIVANLADKLGIGIFRALPERKGQIVEANKQFADILGYNSLTEIVSLNILNLFENPAEKKLFLSTLVVKSFINDYHCKAIKKDGSVTDLLLSAAAVKTKDGALEYIDGIITDFSGQKEIEFRMENLIAGFINSFSFWDIPVTSLPLRNIPECDPDISVTEALDVMKENSTDFLFFKPDRTPHSVSNKIQTGKTPEDIFLLDKKEIRSRLFLSELKAIPPLSEFAERITIELSEKSTVIEAGMNMLRNNRNYELVEVGEIASRKEIKVFMMSDLVTLLSSNSRFLIERIAAVKSPEELQIIHKELPLYISNFVLAGTDINIITKIITSVSDSITNFIIGEAINKMGNPPCKFSFIALGSEGRSEQGLSTDQDNAIIYENPDENLTQSEIKSVEDYFLGLASIINKLLNETGYELCQGDIMAKNSRWNKPINVWEKYFKTWITVPDEKSLIDSSIFFDLRHIYGDLSLTNNLKNFINISIKNNPAFLAQAAILTANYKLPVGMFGKIQTESKEQQHNSFNLKNAIRLLVNIVRLYSMKHSLLETNTLSRLEKLYDSNLIQESFYSELKYCFKYLMTLQFTYQIRNYRKGLEVGHYLSLDLLTETELNNLKNVLGTISAFQSKVKFDFGVSG